MMKWWSRSLMALSLYAPSAIRVAPPYDASFDAIRNGTSVDAPKRTPSLSHLVNQTTLRPDTPEQQN